MEKIMVCQSCSMPIMKDADKGTNADETKSNDYCVHCFVKGEFAGYQTVEEAIADSVNFAEHAGMTKEDMLKYAEKNYPNLKRWKKQ